MTEQCSRSTTSGMGTDIVVLSGERGSKVLSKGRIGGKDVENDDDEDESCCR